MEDPILKDAAGYGKVRTNLLLYDSLQPANDLRPEAGIVLIRRPEAWANFKRRRRTKCAAVQQLEGRRMEETIDQPQARVRSPAKGAVAVIAQTGAYREFARHRKFILRIQGPDRRTIRFRREWAPGLCEALVLPQVLGDFRSHRDFVLLQYRSAQLRVAVPPISTKRVGLQRGRTARARG